MSGFFVAVQRLVGRMVGRCKCGKFVPNWGKLHASCKHAALNGVAISLPAIRYCPWCGCRVPPNAGNQGHVPQGERS
jgi:hypothetical protein